METVLMFLALGLLFGGSFYGLRTVFWHTGVLRTALTMMYLAEPMDSSPSLSVPFSRATPGFISAFIGLMILAQFS